MINKYSFMVFIFLILFSIFVTNCSDDEDKETLVGTWVLTSMKMTSLGFTVTMDPAEMGISMRLTVRSDNSYTMVMTEDDVTTTSNGEWATSGGKLFITEEGDTEEYDYSLKGDKLEVSFEEIEEGQTVTITQVFTRQ
ncbi:MAG: lipocalin family protein [Calditrichaceae bacterium]|nr:lipocalin family protein [Calditrichaceae bacterium]